MIVTLYPEATIWPKFLLPDGSDLLDAINAVAGGFENSVVAVTRRTGNQDRSFADFQATNSLDNGNALNLRILSPYFLCNLPKRFLRHRYVGFIEEVISAGLSTGLVSYPTHHAAEDRQRARLRTCDAGRDLVQVKPVIGDSEIFRPLGVAAATHGWKQGDGIAI